MYSVLEAEPQLWASGGPHHPRAGALAVTSTPPRCRPGERGPWRKGDLASLLSLLSQLTVFRRRKWDFLSVIQFESSHFHQVPTVCPVRDTTDSAARGSVS